MYAEFAISCSFVQCLCVELSLDHFDSIISVITDDFRQFLEYLYQSQQGFTTTVEYSLNGKTWHLWRQNYLTQVNLE